MRNRQIHLTDEQLSDLLLGASPQEVTRHLAECSRCSAEASKVSLALGSFEQQTMLWAQRRASQIPAFYGDLQQSFLWLSRPQVLAFAAFSLVLAAVLGVSVAHHGAPAPAQPVAAVQARKPVPAATLKQDNELLSAIDGELRADDSLAGPYGLRVADGARRGAKVAN